jgi:hypothetical protein
MLTLVPSMLKAQIKDSMKIQERDSLRIVAKDSVISDKAEIKDSAEVAASDSFFLLRSKGLLRRLARSIVTDTTVDPNLVRIDQLYRRYTGRIIRKIEIRSIDFGIPINDTSRSFKNTLTRWADALHHTTREQVIRNNLFFKVNDTLLPILLADNERHLRDQTYLNDVKIIVKRVMGTRDSVDILVLTKDVLSIGGKLKMSSLNRIETAIREDNFGGTGNRIQISTYYDQMRSRRFGYGAEYILRNIKGSFIDASLGFLDYSQSFNTYQKQEKTFYTRLIRPLVNPYMKWTYAFEAATHQNYNMYLPDSLYQSDYAYQYYNVDAWVAFNKSAKTIKQFSDDRLRTLIGLRFLHTEFQKIPQKYVENYFYQYADLTGVLGNIAIFRQDFYKTQYVYGFGRNEDVPEGIDFSVTTGWTNKNQRIRPYMGLDMQYNYFSKKKNYFNYTLRVGGYSYHKKYEDISILGNLEFFTRLKQLSKKWKQRTFITAGITTQLKKELNEPLLLESQYGLQEYQDIHLGGDHRLTVKAETVFFNNWSLASFRFAPFVFGNGTLLTPQNESLKQTKFYNSIGGGLRSRNESLVFGTLELKAYYFPHANFNGDRWRVEFNTNIKFKYSTQTIRRPEFIAVN